MAIAQKLRCLVERIVAHGDRVYTVALRSERPLPRFRAGQFLHLALDAYDPTTFWPDSRVFSIASPPGERDAVRITYSVQGRFTTRMEAELTEGRYVWIKMPYGEFVIDATQRAVLFAGGTGITAFTAFLEGLDGNISNPVILAYGARADRLLIYRDVVERCAARVSSLDPVYFVEAPGPATESAIPVSAGRVSVADIWPRLARPFESQFYISGPPSMLRGIGDDLRARHVAPEAIHIDAWE